uniref:Carotenoid oxygenase n=1 Tax=Rhodosorus marinus TaxID=101924 RepID=A0A7S3A2A5_9RHOD
MIHSVRFQVDDDGVHRAYYTNRFIKTGFIKIADLLQRPPVNITVQKGIRGLMNVLYNLLRVVRFDAQEYRYDNYALLGTANTAVSYFPLNDGNGKRDAVLALYDSDAPYEIKLTKARDPIIQHTLGTGTYNPYGLDHPMTPHPRYSPQTKEMISFGVGMDFPRLKNKSTPVLFINGEGKIYRTTDVKTRTSVYQHDFAITKNFVVMQDNPNTIDPFRMMFKPFNGTPISWDNRKRTSFVLLPRTSPDDVKKSEGAKILHGDEALVDKTKEFFLPEGEECFIFHYANGWEEDDKIVFYGTHHAKLNLVRFNSRYPPPKDLLPKFYRFELDLTTGTASKQLVFGSEDALVTKLPDNVDCPIDDLVVDFCNASFEKSGEKSDFLYMCYTKAVEDISELITPDDVNKGWSLGFWQGVLKLNTTTHEVEAITYPPLMNGGEAIFQPKVNAQSEDDGYLISHVTALEPVDGAEAEVRPINGHIGIRSRTKEKLKRGFCSHSTNRILR